MFPCPSSPLEYVTELEIGLERYLLIALILQYPKTVQKKITEISFKKFINGFTLKPCFPVSFILTGFTVRSLETICKT